MIHARLSQCECCGELRDGDCLCKQPKGPMYDWPYRHLPTDQERYESNHRGVFKPLALPAAPGVIIDLNEESKRLEREREENEEMDAAAELMSDDERAAFMRWRAARRRGRFEARKRNR